MLYANSLTDLSRTIGADSRPKMEAVTTTKLDLKPQRPDVAGMGTFGFWNGQHGSRFVPLLNGIHVLKWQVNIQTMRNKRGDASNLWEFRPP